MRIRCGAGPANLVARARLRLEEALDALPPKRWYERLSQRMMNNFASLQAAPVRCCLLLVAGPGAGCLGGYQFAQNRAAHCAAPPRPLPSDPCMTAGGAAVAGAPAANDRQHLQHCAPAQQRDGRGALQPGGAAAHRGLAGRSGDPPVADAGQ
jgi:hypothetical protein